MDKLKLIIIKIQFDDCYDKSLTTKTHKTGILRNYFLKHYITNLNDLKYLNVHILT